MEDLQRDELLIRIDERTARMEMAYQKHVEQDAETHRLIHARISNSRDDLQKQINSVRDRQNVMAGGVVAVSAIIAAVASLWDKMPWNS